MNVKDILENWGLSELTERFEGEAANIFYLTLAIDVDRVEVVTIFACVMASNVFV